MTLTLAFELKIQLEAENLQQGEGGEAEGGGGSLID